MATAKPSQIKILSDLEIEMTRVFDAPRELVFKVYTDPATIPQWWGPRGSTTVVDKHDPRPGGQWRYVEQSADGSINGFRGEFREVKAPERLVYTFEWEGLPGHISVDALTFEAHGPHTVLRAVTTFASVE